MIKRAVALFVMAVAFTTLVSSLGVSPGRITLDFSPGLEKTLHFSIINTERENLDLALVPQGELKKYITLEKNLISLSSTESSKEISYSVKLPENLSPGLHKGGIAVVQIPKEFSSTKEATIGASIAILSQLYVNVPYPGKYAEASLNVVGPDKNGKVTFVIPVESKGEFDLTKVKAVIDIYSSLNEKVDTVYTNEVSIPSKKRKEVIAEWDSSSFPKGPYRAVATLQYDGNSIKLEKEFEIGEKRLKIISIEVNNFHLGDIAKFEILVENEWSEMVKGVYAEMKVYDSKKNVLGDFKSPLHDIAPLSKELMTSFWDTAGVKEGVYDAEILLKYSNKAEKQDLKLDIRKDKINIIGLGYVISEREYKTDKTFFILIGIIAILILLNILWFLIIRRKLKGK